MPPAFSTSHPQGHAAEGQGTDEVRLLTAEEAWTEACAELRRRMAERTFVQWVAPARVMPAEGDALKLGYPSMFMVDWVRTHYRERFEDELLAVANRRIPVEITERDPEPSEVEARETPAEAVAPPAPAPAPKLALVEAPRGLRGPSLTPRYNFDTFVVGASNQLAYAACHAVAESLGTAYNPLFLYGGVGLGKTHLMQAVGNHAAGSRQRVLYASSEQFVNEFVSAIQQKKVDEFRRRYRECDVLLIDDVQMLAGKERTEEEFFHTFNVLHQQNKQIIVTSDTVPHEIDRMEERLRSRFQWGLIADIRPPEMETRMAILRTKAQEMGLELDDEVITFLATHIRQNVRELEGALRRVRAMQQVTRGPLSLELCKNVLRSILVNKGEKLDCEQIMKQCSQHFKVTVAELKSPSRKKNLARARQAAMFLCRRLTGASFPDIGERFGGRDHTTVLYACDRVVELMKGDADYRKSVETLERELSQIGGV